MAPYTVAAALAAARKADSGYSTRRTPAPPSSAALKRGVWPNSVMLASTGTSRLANITELDRKSTRLNSSHSQISYAVFCLKKKKNYLLTIAHLHTQSTPTV